MMTTVHTIPGLLDLAAGGPDGITVYDRSLAGEELSYAELARRARAAGRRLIAHGVEPGDRVCLLAGTSPQLLVALFGTWYAGAAPVILPHPQPRTDPQVYAADIAGRIDQVAARLLMVGEIFADLPAGRLGARVVRLGDLDVPGDAPPAGAVNIDPDGLGFVQFTSGSTGRSRAVTLTHRQLLANVTSIGAALDLGPGQRYVSWLPLYHDMGLISLVTMVGHGMSMFLQPTEEFARAPRSWMEAVSRFRATITVGPNFAWGLATRDLAARKPGSVDLSALLVAGNGAEPIEAGALQDFTEAAARHGLRPGAVCPMYGLAEATLAVALSRSGEPVREIVAAPDRLHQGAAVRPVPADAPYRRRVVSCGTPVPGIAVAVRSAAGEVLGEGIVGEVCVHGPSVMTGYWEDTDATGAALRDGCLHTGDLGFFDGGELFLCGRIKDMIIVGGRNLYPEDYEHWAARQPGVRRGNAIAFGMPDLERMVVVAETPRSGDNARKIAHDVMRALRDRLPHAPHEVVLVASGTLPKTTSGKVQRRLCQSWYRAGKLPVVATTAGS